MDTIKQKVIYLFFTHIFLRRIGKRYPEFFKKWIYDYVENAKERKILLMRYTGDTKKKFTAIAIELGLDESNLFKYHKKAVERLISAC
jgi:hypothetical protein